ncbi:hypothetical protein BOSE62_40501 [Bosea sp. 62]|nr:hypothetical protein BOSE46_120283 [Bosea sp. 46]CAD5260999.1 hypothetical protein BOSE21B_110503 [Bosea sp. 21B]CAD5279635.1 hypothetical protein BOSE7B_40713 [Bosea sp. 7B]VVT58377.1 hypothetical protein BOS5A_200555 [Bosea sp. EC-HK365B]VXB52375.1 hypothetical protein BOSE29B_110448 [Bosea sp. 29B]VXB94813.1 hypothetical protein BOSE125_160240 [Bosea sp. 125]VXC46360.1 hypothetical protein BOSE62_40501 [Bosea sp. 62]VXC83322.1 hypothetical protein BOSE127_60111 [Bosea sp. 127]
MHQTAGLAVELRQDVEARQSEVEVLPELPTQFGFDQGRASEQPQPEAHFAPVILIAAGPLAEAEIVQILLDAQCMILLSFGRSVGLISVFADIAQKHAQWNQSFCRKRV